jgi:hypothetical protein
LNQVSNGLLKTLHMPSLDCTGTHTLQTQFVFILHIRN